MPFTAVDIPVPDFRIAFVEELPGADTQGNAFEESPKLA